MLMDMQPSGEGRLPDHGRVACTACFGGEAVVFDASRTGSTNWRITANPCAWGNPNAEVVVLGFSKGPTQAGALARTPHDEIAYKGARHNVGRILHAVGLLENGAKVDDLITDQKGRLAFGSLVRCTVEQRDIRKGTWKGAGGDMLGGHCHVGQLWLERTRQAKLAACRPSPPPTPATVSRPRSSSMLSGSTTCSA